MNLVIDRGNTQLKYGIFDQCQLIHSDLSDFLDKKNIKHLNDRFHIQRIIISSVVKERHDELLANLSAITPTVIDLQYNTPLPFDWQYNTKETIGKDRLAAVAGAISLYPNNDLLVIDAGTAITYELVKDGIYMGGNISPGLSMRFKALNHFTSRLPLLSKEDNTPLIGSSTAEAITAGVQNGLTFEIDGLIEELSPQYESLKTIITGGDAEFFARKLKNPIFVHPNLVLIGLNRILEYNAQYI
ncbi:type III pantothenate kinase [Carboxylicivirga sediminis]|uniref:Type III pantothenate kinase n=1 Tax=Carboxylicivirga sediminis TaxID=2006564 RepID=A0A941IW91_9BACT|nr:type III pantothenate kinase [Carboxylicivirga sediminis]MBR8534224.1 type III pantothenate kinase [Carboxylicivirga sediminis]